MEIFDLLTKMSEPCAPSGFENAAGSAAADLLATYCDFVKTDRLGNVMGVKLCGAQNAKTIMLDAHIDQIGFIVTNVDKDGFLKVKSIGGIDARMLPSCEVKILTEPPVYGVFTSVPPHLQSAENARETIKIDDLYIDSGLAENAENIIKVGMPVTFANDLCRLSENTVSGRGIDDRLGFCTLISVLDKLKNCKLGVNIVTCGTVCEETGGAGAKTAAFSVNPDCAIAVDVSHAKTHDCSNDETFEFGGGPLIGLGPNLDRKISGGLIEIAKSSNISYQTEVMEGSTGTNAWHIQTSQSGIPCGLVSIPIKYMHTPIETADLNDAENTAEIIAGYIKQMR